MDLAVTEFLSGLMAIVLLDLVLAGDNAIVIALAARRLPRDIQKKAVLWGTFGAIIVRLALTGVVVYLLKLPGLMLIGGLLLLPIAWTLLNPAVTGAIVGSRSAKQAEGVMKAGDIKLTAQDIAQIEGKAAAMAVR